MGEEYSLLKNTFFEKIVKLSFQSILEIEISIQFVVLLSPKTTIEIRYTYYNGV